MLISKGNIDGDLVEVNDALYEALISSWIYNTVCEGKLDYNFGADIEPISRHVFIFGDVQSLIQLTFSFKYTGSEGSKKRKRFCEDLCVDIDGMEYEKENIGDEYFMFRYVFYSDTNLSELKKHINFMKVKYGNSVKLIGDVEYDFVLYREEHFSPQTTLKILQCF